MKTFQIEQKLIYRYTVQARDEDHAWTLAEDCDPEDFGAVCLQAETVNVTEVDA